MSDDVNERLREKNVQTTIRDWKARALALA